MAVQPSAIHWRRKLRARHKAGQRQICHGLQHRRKQHRRQQLHTLAGTAVRRMERGYRNKGSGRISHQQKRGDNRAERRTADVCMAASHKLRKLTGTKQDNGGILLRRRKDMAERAGDIYRNRHLRTGSVGTGNDTTADRRAPDILRQRGKRGRRHAEHIDETLLQRRTQLAAGHGDSVLQKRITRRNAGAGVSERPQGHSRGYRRPRIHGNFQADGGAHRRRRQLDKRHRGRQQRTPMVHIRLKQRLPAFRGLLRSALSDTAVHGRDGIFRRIR